MNRIDTILESEDLLAGAAPAVVEAAKRAKAGEALPEDAGCPYDLCGGTYRRQIRALVSLCRAAARRNAGCMRYGLAFD